SSLRTSGMPGTAMISTALLLIIDRSRALNRNAYAAAAARARRRASENAPGLVPARGRPDAGNRVRHSNRSARRARRRRWTRSIDRQRAPAAARRGAAASRPDPPPTFFPLASAPAPPIGAYPRAL